MQTWFKLSKTPKMCERFTEDVQRQKTATLTDDFPMSGLQDAINRFLFKKECSYMFIESGGPAHLSTMAVKYDLNFTSLPWILSVPLKQGERCQGICDIGFELQLKNVNFILSAIIWGDAKNILLGFLLI